MASKLEHRPYRTEIPNIVDDAKLSPCAYRLYGHIKRVAGDNSVCSETTRHMAEKCQMSIGQISKSKHELLSHGFITLERGPFGRDIIRPTNVWQLNFEKYNKETRSDSEQKTCSDDEQTKETCSQYEQEAEKEDEIKETCSYSERIENNNIPNATHLGAEHPPLLDFAEQIQVILKKLENAKPNERQPILLEAYRLCFGSESVPSYSYIGKAARDVGGAAMLVDKMVALIARPPIGDKLTYIVQAHKSEAKRKQGSAYRNGGGNQDPDVWQKIENQTDNEAEYLKELRNGN